MYAFKKMKFDDRSDSELETEGDAWAKEIRARFYLKPRGFLSGKVSHDLKYVCSTEPLRTYVNLLFSRIEATANLHQS